MAAENLFPVNNLARSMWKQIIVKFNNTLMSPSTDTYHQKAHLETLTNFDRADGETVLKPQGWYNAIDPNETWTANKLDSSAPHANYTALSATQKESVLAMKAEVVKYVGGATHILRFKPHLEVFHLNKLLVPEVQIDIQMYLKPPSIFFNRVGQEGSVHEADIKVRFYLCQVKLNPSTYLSLSSEYPAMYPTVRGEIRTYSIPDTALRYECNNVFQGRIPNRVIAGMVFQTAFTERPFCLPKV